MKVVPLEYIQNLKEFKRMKHEIIGMIKAFSDSVDVRCNMSVSIDTVFDFYIGVKKKFLSEINEMINSLESFNYTDNSSLERLETISQILEQIVGIFQYYLSNDFYSVILLKRCFNYFIEESIRLLEDPSYRYNLRSFFELNKDTLSFCLNMEARAFLGEKDYLGNQDVINDAINYLSNLENTSYLFIYQCFKIMLKTFGRNISYKNKEEYFIGEIEFKDIQGNSECNKYSTYGSIYSFITLLNFIQSNISVFHINKRINQIIELLQLKGIDSKCERFLNEVYDFFYVFLGTYVRIYNGDVVFLNTLNQFLDDILNCLKCEVYKSPETLWSNSRSYAIKRSFLLLCTPGISYFNAGCMPKSDELTKLVGDIIFDETVTNSLYSTNELKNYSNDYNLFVK